MSVQERSTASRDSSQKLKVHHRPADINKLQQSASLTSKTSTPRTSLDGQSSPLKKLDFWDRLSPSKTASDVVAQSKTVSDSLTFCGLCPISLNLIF